MTLPLAYAAYDSALRSLAILLAMAWWSDYYDGVFARRAGGGTRFSNWDLPVDTAVGAALLAGFVGGGHISAWFGLVGLVLGAGFIVLRNPAWSMLLQAVGYAWSLWFTLQAEAMAFTLLVLSIVAIAVHGRSRLTSYVLPAFFDGIRGRGTG